MNRIKKQLGEKMRRASHHGKVETILSRANRIETPDEIAHKQETMDDQSKEIQDIDLITEKELEEVFIKTELDKAAGNNNTSEMLKLTQQENKHSGRYNFIQ